MGGGVFGCSSGTLKGDEKTDKDIDIECKLTGRSSKHVKKIETKAQSQTLSNPSPQRIRSNHPAKHKFNHKFNKKLSANKKQLHWFTAKSQVQSQMQVHADDQMKKTAETQTLIEQVDDTIESIVIAAEMAQNPKMNQATVNRVTDGAILAFNMLVVSCQEFFKGSDQNSIKLANKRVYDQFETLKSKNITYKKIKPYRDLIFKVLNGERDLQYKLKRVRPLSKPLFQHDPKTINKSFAPIIRSNQQFDERQQLLLEPNTNQQLAAQHQSELKEFRDNDKYKKNSDKEEYYNPPQQCDLYFTKTGKESTFIDEESVARKEAEEKDIETELMGPSECVYDILQSMNLKYANAVVKLSPNPICCQILPPKDRLQSEMISVRPCFPFNNQVRDVRLELLELDPHIIKQCEDAYIRKYNTQLGYQSITQQEQQESALSTEIDVEYQKDIVGY